MLHLKSPTDLKHSPPPEERLITAWKLSANGGSYKYAPPLMINSDLHP